jgi:RimJ/RimL family protein N-acetyltransferase
MSLAEHWPLFDLHMTTPRLTLRPATDDDFPGLIKAVQAGVHDPGTMPFLVPWTDLPSPELERSAMQFWWGCRSGWSPQEWNLNLAVIIDGEPIGYQSLHASNFPTLGSIETGSWISLPWQGKGIGKEMRRAAVTFAFDYLGAQRITSAAFIDNLASQKVSLATGYEPNGTQVAMRRGTPAEQIRFLLTRRRWEAISGADPLPIQVTGFDRCRTMFALPPN